MIDIARPQLMDTKTQNVEDDLLNLGVRHAGRTEKTRSKRQVRILDIKIAPPSFCTFANTELGNASEAADSARQNMLGHVMYHRTSTNSIRLAKGF